MSDTKGQEVLAGKLVSAWKQTKNLIEYEDWRLKDYRKKKYYISQSKSNLTNIYLFNSVKNSCYICSIEEFCNAQITKKTKKL